MKILIIMGIMISGNLQASVNDCEILTKGQAMHASEVVRYNHKFRYNVIDLYCEACKDSYPKPILVDRYSVKKNGEGYSLFLDGISYNLAFLYSGGVNLAQLVGCRTFAVAKYLYEQ